MVKIKRKVEKNLPQLIEWAWNNPELVKSKIYLTKEHDEYSPYVLFSVDGYGVITSQHITNNDTFTVEVEETVTEDTKFKYLIEIAMNGSSILWKRSNINQRIGNQSREFHAYIDGEFKLIWRDGKLVE